MYTIIVAMHHTNTDIWAMLVELNIQDEKVMDQYYEFLYKHPGRVKQLFGMPYERCMTKLFAFMTRH